MACLKFKRKDKDIQMNFASVGDAQVFYDTYAFLADNKFPTGDPILVGSPFNLDASTQKALGVTTYNLVDLLKTSKMEEFMNLPKKNLAKFMYIDAVIANAVKVKLEDNYENVKVEIATHSNNTRVMVTVSGLDNAVQKAPSTNWDYTNSVELKGYFTAKQFVPTNIYQVPDNITIFGENTETVTVPTTPNNPTLASIGPKPQIEALPAGATAMFGDDAYALQSHRLISDDVSGLSLDQTEHPYASRLYDTDLSQRRKALNVRPEVLETFKKNGFSDPYDIWNGTVVNPRLTEDFRKASPDSAYIAGHDVPNRLENFFLRLADTFLVDNEQRDQYRQFRTSNDAINGLAYLFDSYKAQGALHASLSSHERVQTLDQLNKNGIIYNSGAYQRLMRHFFNYKGQEELKRFGISTNAFLTSHFATHFVNSGASQVAFSNVNTQGNYSKNANFNVRYMARGNKNPQKAPKVLSMSMRGKEDPYGVAFTNGIMTRTINLLGQDNIKRLFLGKYINNITQLGMSVNIDEKVDMANILNRTDTTSLPALLLGPNYVDFMDTVYQIDPKDANKADSFQSSIFEYLRYMVRTDMAHDREGKADEIARIMVFYNLYFSQEGVLWHEAFNPKFTFKGVEVDLTTSEPMSDLTLQKFLEGDHRYVVGGSKHGIDMMRMYSGELGLILNHLAYSDRSYDKAIYDNGLGSLEYAQQIKLAIGHSDSYALADTTLRIMYNQPVTRYTDAEKQALKNTTILQQKNNYDFFKRLVEPEIPYENDDILGTSSVAKKREGLYRQEVNRERRKMPVWDKGLQLMRRPEMFDAFNKRYIGILANTKIDDGTLYNSMSLLSEMAYKFRGPNFDSKLPVEFIPGDDHYFDQANGIIALPEKYKSVLQRYNEAKPGEQIFTNANDVVLLEDFMRSFFHEVIHASMYNNIVTLGYMQDIHTGNRYISFNGFQVPVDGTNPHSVELYELMATYAKPDDKTILNKLSESEELIAQAFTGANFKKLGSRALPVPNPGTADVVTYDVYVKHDDPDTKVHFIDFQHSNTEVIPEYKGEKTELDTIVNDFVNVYNRNSSVFSEKNLSLNYEEKVEGKYLDAFLGPLMLKPGDLVEVPFTTKHKDAQGVWTTTAIDGEKSMYNVVVRTFPKNEYFDHEYVYTDSKNVTHRKTRRIQKVVIHLGYRGKDGKNHSRYISNEALLTHNMDMVKSIRRRIGHKSMAEITKMFTEADLKNFEGTMKGYVSSSGKPYQAPDWKHYKIMGNYQGKEFLTEKDYHLDYEHRTPTYNDLAFAVKKGDVVRVNWVDKEGKAHTTWRPVVESRADGVVVAYRSKKDASLQFQFVRRTDILEAGFSPEHVRESIEKDHVEMRELIQKHWDKDDPYSFKNDKQYKRHMFEYLTEDKKKNVLKYLDLTQKNLALIEFEHEGKTKRRYVPILAVSAKVLYYPIVWGTDGTVDNGMLKDAKYGIGTASIDPTGTKSAKILQVLKDVGQFQKPYDLLQSRKAMIEQSWNNYTKGNKPGISMDEYYSLHHPSAFMMSQLKPGDIIKKKFTTKDNKEGSIWVVFSGFDKNGRMKTISRKSHDYVKPDGTIKSYNNYVEYTTYYDDIEAIGLDKALHADYFKYKMDKASEYFTSEKHHAFKEKGLTAAQLPHKIQVSSQMQYSWNMPGLPTFHKGMAFVKAKLIDTPLADGSSKKVLHLVPESDPEGRYVTLKAGFKGGAFTEKMSDKYFDQRTYIKNEKGTADLQTIFENYTPGMILKAEGKYNGTEYKSSYMIDRIYHANGKYRITMYGKKWDNTTASYNTDGKANIKEMTVDLEWFLSQQEKVVIGGHFKNDVKIDNLRQGNNLSAYKVPSSGARIFSGRQAASRLPIGKSVTDIHKLVDIVEKIRKIYPEIEFNLEHEGKERASVKGNVITINLQAASLGDPVHELAHMFFPMLMSKNPELYESIVEEVTSSPLYKEVVMNYPELDEYGLFEETFVTLVGQNYEKPKGMLQNFFDFLKGIFVDIFGLRVHTIANIQLISLNDIANLYATDLFKRKYIDNSKADISKKLNIQTIC